MPPITIAVWAAVLVAYGLLRLYAARRVRAGHLRWLWVSQSLPIATGFILVAVAVGIFRTSPFMSLLIGGFGALWAAMATFFVRKSIRAMAPATTPDLRADALVEPLADYMLAMMAFGLLAGLAMLVGILVLAVTGQL